MYVQTAGGLYRPKVYALALAQPTPAQLASGTKPKTCKQFLDDFFKVFSGYHFRADADNKLTVVRPWWAYDA
ncbi:hypothetical protein OFC17_36395, partial [Escherichia coli]|nr:hypothetical protein [Escherichia coli]